MPRNVKCPDTDQPDFSEYLAIDIEHNGDTGGDNDQVLEVAALKICDGKVINDYHQRIKLEVKFNEHLAEKIGLDEGNYQNGSFPSEHEALEEFRTILVDHDLVA